MLRNFVCEEELGLKDDNKADKKLNEGHEKGNAKVTTQPKPNIAPGPTGPPGPSTAPSKPPTESR